LFRAVLAGTEVNRIVRTRMGAAGSPLGEEFTDVVDTHGCVYKPPTR